jgi:hypothetical protein
MRHLTRREALKILSVLLPASAIKCRSDDVFTEERVCVHVYNRTIAPPEPLLKRYDQIPTRSKETSLFQIGIPELLVCATPEGLLPSFQYFWPLTRDEFQEGQRRMTVRFQQEKLSGRENIDQLRKFLEQEASTRLPKEEKTALLGVLNDYTRYWIAEVLKLWQESPIGEVVIFKDPTKSPYLCDYPALQKGFKRQPP